MESPFTPANPEMGLLTVQLYQIAIVDTFVYSLDSLS